MKEAVKFNHFWRRIRSLFQRYVLRKKIGRQPFPIMPVSNPDTFFRGLIEIGFQPNYFAYYDKGEIYNVRRLNYNDNELWQEHIRIFPDEIRGHYEISYEEDARKHISGETLRPLSDETLKELDDLL